jgi:hypothetical protein
VHNVIKNIESKTLKLPTKIFYGTRSRRVSQTTLSQDLVGSKIEEPSSRLAKPRHDRCQGIATTREASTSRKAKATLPQNLPKVAPKITRSGTFKSETPKTQRVYPSRKLRGPVDMSESTEDLSDLTNPFYKGMPLRKRTKSDLEVVAKNKKFFDKYYGST